MVHNPLDFTVYLNYTNFIITHKLRLYVLLFPRLMHTITISLNIFALYSLHLFQMITQPRTFSFVDEFNSLDNNKFLISFDVQSLFTNIPLTETIDIAVDVIHTNIENFPVNKTDLKKLFLFATAENHFLFDSSYYDQIDGVAMGSSLAPVLANLFMSHHERTWLSNYNNLTPLFYRRYVDDIFCMFHTEQEALLFFDYLNLQHPNIKFTSENESNNQISRLS